MWTGFPIDIIRFIGDFLSSNDVLVLRITSRFCRTALGLEEYILKRFGWKFDQVGSSLAIMEKFQIYSNVMNGQMSFDKLLQVRSIQNSNYKTGNIPQFNHLWPTNWEDLCEENNILLQTEKWQVKVFSWGKDELKISCWKNENTSYFTTSDVTSWNLPELPARPFAVQNNDGRLILLYLVMNGDSWNLQCFDIEYTGAHFVCRKSCHIVANAGIFDSWKQIGPFVFIRLQKKFHVTKTVGNRKSVKVTHIIYNDFPFDMHNRVIGKPIRHE